MVPLADRHRLSIGFTTVAGRACFGVYCDSEALPDAHRLTAWLHRSLDDLMELAEATAREQAGARA